MLLCCAGKAACAAQTAQVLRPWHGLKQFLPSATCRRLYFWVLSGVQRALLELYDQGLLPEGRLGKQRVVYLTWLIMAAIVSDTALRFFSDCKFVYSFWEQQWAIKFVEAARTQWRHYDGKQLLPLSFETLKASSTLRACSSSSRCSCQTAQGWSLAEPESSRRRCFLLTSSFTETILQACFP